MQIELSMGILASAQQSSESHSHGTAVLLRLVEPRFGTDKVVCADSFFASVNTAFALQQKGLSVVQCLFGGGSW